MPNMLRLEIVTPERLVASLEVQSVTGAGILGEFTVLPLHVPFLSALQVGYLGYRLGGERQNAFVAGGFAEVVAGRVLIMAEAAELPEEIDVDRAKKARLRAEARLEAQRRENIDYARAKAALQRAVMRIRLRELTGSGQAGHPSASSS